MIEFKWDTDEGSRMGIEKMLLVTAVRDGWKKLKAQEVMISKLLTGEIKPVKVTP